MITSFRGKYNFLSNFYTCRIERDGLKFWSAEAAFQAAKFPKNRELQTRISETTDPRNAKRLGKSAGMRKDWDRVRLGVMLDVLMIKFSDPYLQGLLLGTGNEEIAEVNTWGDKYWGMFQGEGSEIPEGQNNLGKLLMMVRSSYKCNGGM